MNTELSKKNEAAPARREERTVVRPRVDVFENASEYLLVADLPGVSRDALEIQFHDGELRLAAKRAAARPGQALATESTTADFERAFAMPDGIDAENISAELASGVLRVRLPKSAAKQARKIAVRAG